MTRGRNYPVPAGANDSREEIEAALFRYLDFPARLEHWMQVQELAREEQYRDFLHRIELGKRRA